MGSNSGLPALALVGTQVPAFALGCGPRGRAWRPQAALWHGPGGSGLATRTRLGGFYLLAPVATASILRNPGAFGGRPPPEAATRRRWFLWRRAMVPKQRGQCPSRIIQKPFPGPRGFGGLFGRQQPWQTLWKPWHSSGHHQPDPRIDPRQMAQDRSKIFIFFLAR